MLKKSKNKGITLIALVITIIVLLILAGISISMLAGDNGILQRATTTKENTYNSQIQERINLAYHSSLVDGQGKLTEPSIENELKKEFNKDTLEKGWLDKTSVEGKWRITIDGVSLDIPEGISETMEMITFYIEYEKYEGIWEYSVAKGTTFEEWIENDSPKDPLEYDIKAYDKGITERT